MALKKTRRPSKKAPVYKLRHKVTYTYLCNKFGNPNTVRELAELVDPSTRFNEDEQRWELKRMWEMVAAGKYGFSARRLEMLEPLVPGITKLNKHSFWDFIEGREFERDELIAIIRKLPHGYSEFLIENPDPYTGFVKAKSIPFDYEYFCVQSLGTLDAVAALLAAGKMWEEEHFEGLVADCIRAAAHLLLHISMFSPVDSNIDEIWSHFKCRYLDKWTPHEFKSVSDMRDDCKVVLDVCGKLTMFGPDPDQYMDILLIADRWYFGNIISAAREVHAIFDRNDLREKADKILLAVSELCDDLQFVKIEESTKSKPYPNTLLDQLERRICQSLPEYSFLNPAAGEYLDDSDDMDGIIIEPRW